MRMPWTHRRGDAGRYMVEYGASLSAFFGAATVLHHRRPYDVVQANSMPDVLAFAGLVPRLRGAAVVVDLHEVMPELYVSKFGGSTADPMPRLLARLEQAAIRFADAAIAVSGPCADVFVSRGADPAKLSIVMNSADPAVFRHRPPRRPPKSTPRIVSHGTLVERYGFDDLLAAVSRLPAVELELIGDGEARPGLEARAGALGMRDRVRFVGHLPLDAVPERLWDANVGVVANRSDPFTDLVLPTKLLEYVAVGLPVVAPRTPAIVAHFDEASLFLFAPGDVDDMARALRQALTCSDEAERRAQRAARIESAQYAWPAMSRRYVDLLEGLARRR
jgi:glycosyltransferase involved in cell wall biosynthesis